MTVMAVASPITPKQARTAALNFMSRMVPTVTKSSSCQLAYAEAGQQDGDTLFFVFNVGGGFAIVSADDAVTPILGYSPDGHFGPQNIPDNCRAWLQSYADVIAQVRAQQVAPLPDMAAKWDALLSEDANGCTETDTLYLTITDPPVVDFGGDIHIQQGETAHIYDHLGGNPNWYYYWNNGMEGPSIDVSPSVTTTYTVVVYTDGTFSCYTTATVTVVVTTGVSDYEVEELTLYPNPTSGKVVIDRENVLSVEVFDKTGRLLTVRRDVNEIDLGAFADGIYTLRISLPEGVVIRKVVKTE